MRRDSRGRRIGRNWWREYNMALFTEAMIQWDADCEAVTLGYATERAEYLEDNPMPNLKSFLLANKGMSKPI